MISSAEEAAKSVKHRRNVHTNSAVLLHRRKRNTPRAPREALSDVRLTPIVEGCSKMRIEDADLAVADAQFETSVHTASSTLVVASCRDGQFTVMVSSP